MGAQISDHISFTRSVLASLHPSVPPSRIFLATSVIPFAAPSLHPFFFYLSMQHLLTSNSLHSLPCSHLPCIESFSLLSAECLSVCHYSGHGKLCTQVVCSGSQSHRAAAFSIIKCNRTFTFTA